MKRKKKENIDRIYRIYRTSLKEPIYESWVYNKEKRYKLKA
jgi:hypothetical protein